ncbi:MAG TPA: erythromycin esterase family protein [Actinomycetota bacterium]|nr:erythromycin esterase family protein [Actinomycetota bacterium]
MTGSGDAEALEEIRSLAAPLQTEQDLNRLIDHIGDSRYVLLGEASHGTSEYYYWRAAITRRLIAEKGFSFVAVEGDWPDCYRINRWVKHRSDPDRQAAEVLKDFERWPAWMWANTEVAHFLSWLKQHNAGKSRMAGFYGLDVYSLWESLDTVLGYLKKEQPEMLETARRALRCFEPFAEDPKKYARSVGMIPSSCEKPVIDLLLELRSRPLDFNGEPESEFDARQNAEVLAGAERYYRSMLSGDNDSWNIRDIHMADTLDRLMDHHGPAAKAIVWAHNTHIGDARATNMAADGMVNLGQLVRERHLEEGVALIGFGGHRGAVIAADLWGDPQRRKEVPEALEDSHEDLMHRALARDAVLVFPPGRDSGWLCSRRGHRAIGVIYHPASERFGSWVPTVMGRRYDAFLYFEQTSPLSPLHAEAPEPPAEQQTFPWSA